MATDINLNIKIIEAARPEGEVFNTRLFAYFGGGRYEQVTFDCDCGMPCPQGRISSLPRCAIWIATDS